MNIDRLRCFCLAYETRSFARVAQEWFLTRQGASKAVRSIETEWGVSLFDRERDGLTPTKDADAVYSLVKRIVSLYDDVLGLIDSPDISVRVLTVAAAHGAINSLPGEAFTRFSRDCPQMRLDASIMDVDECELAVREGAREVGLTVGPVQLPGLRHIALKREQVFFVGLTTLLDTTGHIRAGTRLYLIDRAFKLDAIVLSELGDEIRGLRIDPGYRNYDSIVEMVKAGLGVCMAPESYLPMFSGADIFTLPLDKNRFSWTVSLIVSSAVEMSPVVAAFTEHLVKVCEAD